MSSFDDTSAMFALYRALCTGALPNPRVEQERIPIAQALARL